MRIKRVRIKNFRCLEDVEVEFDKVTTFIGPNGAGKSTVLRALDWFFNGSKVSELTDNDCTFGSLSKRVVVEVEFCALNDSDREQLGSYVPADSDRFIAWKYREEDGTEKMTGNARSFPPFDKVRECDSATKRKEAYRELRNARPELALPQAMTDQVVSEAMRAWELEHPNDLEESQQVVTNFFGFNSHAKMAGLFDYVLVTADLRASEETQDGKTTIIGRILERAISRDGVDAEVTELAAEVREKQQAIYDVHFADQLDRISKELTGAVSQYTAGRAVRIRTDEIQLKPPKAQFTVSVLDHTVETPITYQGHGFQRTLLVSSLQLLAKHGAAAENKGTICLAIEEPELFQHPVQAQAFATVLRQLAEDLSQNVQVTYATHSPYFISTGHFDEICRVTRHAAADGKRAPAVVIARTSLAAITARLASYVDPAKIERQMDSVCLNRLPEALFANSVVLVEGTTEEGVIGGSADRIGSVSLAVSGVVVASVGTKTGFFLPHAILSELGIPCFVVFDGDSGCTARMQARSKPTSEIVNAEKNNKSLNRKLLRYLGWAEEDWPATVAETDYASIEDTLETLLNDEWPEWVQAKDNIVSNSLGDPKKNALVYRYAARDAATEPPAVLQEIVRRARALAGSE